MPDNSNLEVIASNLSKEDTLVANINTELANSGATVSVTKAKVETETQTASGKKNT